MRQLHHQIPRKHLNLTFQCLLVGGKLFSITINIAAKSKKNALNKIPEAHKALTK